MLRYIHPWDTLVLANRPLQIMYWPSTSPSSTLPATAGKKSWLWPMCSQSTLCVAVPTRNQEAVTVVQVLVRDSVVQPGYGVPERIHSDQGRDFESGLVKGLCQMYGIKKNETHAVSPSREVSHVNASTARFMTCCGP